MNAQVFEAVLRYIVDYQGRWLLADTRAATSLNMAALITAIACQRSASSTTTPTPSRHWMPHTMNTTASHAHFRNIVIVVATLIIHTLAYFYRQVGRLVSHWLRYNCGCQSTQEMINDFKNIVVFFLCHNPKFSYCKFKFL